MVADPEGNHRVLTQHIHDTARNESVGEVLEPFLLLGICLVQDSSPAGEIVHAVHPSRLATPLAGHARRHDPPPDHPSHALMMVGVTLSTPKPEEEH